MDISRLRAYAALIARMGVNVQPGQAVVIRAAAEHAPFAALVAEECYRAGASRVDVDWRDDALRRLDITYQAEDELSRVAEWEEARLKARAAELPANIYLDSDDPDALIGVDQAKWARAQQRRFAVTRPYRDAMENKYAWCVAAVAGRAWARRVFPTLDEASAVEALWAAILRCARADGDDPISAWRAHNERLRRRCDWLNSLSLRALIYKSEESGTDLRVGLIPQMRFMGGAEALPGGAVYFNANIPSEEVFTTPMRGAAEGVVYATRPLAYRGALIEDFYLRFENGRVTQAHARKNDDALQLMLGMDEGARMLGECAFVPYSSPIRESGILFYNTLFDENASCHLALGEGYSSCLDGFESYTPESARALGVNDSMIHEDFMIGTRDLSVIGVSADGREIPIFKDGEWA